MSNEEWVTMTEASERLGVSRPKISRLARKGVIKTKLNPLDGRVRLVNLVELKALLEEYGPRMGDDEDET
jgi:excisionase family DNA binding protein